jgi:hypothetical protein
MQFWIPEQSAGEIVSFVELDAVPAMMALQRWKSLPVGERNRVPAQMLDDHAILVAVEENDYRYASVGAALLPAFGGDFSGRKLSTITDFFPKFGAGLRMLYDMVCASREPLAYRGFVGQDMSGAQFLYHESIILPFGGGQVEQLLVASEIVRRDSLTGKP